MKKILKAFLLSLCLVISACGKEVSVEQARQALSKHLIERYGEEFEIGYMGRRSDGKDTWYQAEIYPSKFNGTSKQYDKYYKQSGTVNIKKNLFGEEIEYVGDTYRIVLINESANNFYLSKLKELFGENILPIFDIFHYEIEPIPDFKKTIDMAKEKGEAPIIKGGIYIFGRVESDEDREWYREQIFKFLTFMKETGTFEYVDLGIIIWDERVLSEEFRTNKDLRKAILVARNTIDNDDEFINKRKKLMKQTDESMKTLTKENKKQILNSYIKSDIYGQKNIVDEIFTYNELLGIKIYSPKYIESQGLTHREKRNYDKVEDIKFWSELY
jgi:hypothetical protein